MDTNQPSLAQFSKETFLEAGQTIAIILLLTSGARPEAVTFITQDDVSGMKNNDHHPNLYQFAVQEFEAEKKGKTKTEIRLSCDGSLYTLMLKYQAMRGN